MGIFDYMVFDVLLEVNGGVVEVVIGIGGIKWCCCECFVCWYIFGGMIKLDMMVFVGKFFGYYFVFVGLGVVKCVCFIVCVLGCVVIYD